MLGECERYINLRDFFLSDKEALSHCQGGVTSNLSCMYFEDIEEGEEASKALRGVIV